MRTEAEIRSRISTVREYGRVGWVAPDRANYALGELHWMLGEDFDDPFAVDE